MNQRSEHEKTDQNQFIEEEKLQTYLEQRQLTEEEKLKKFLEQHPTKSVFEEIKEKQYGGQQEQQEQPSPIDKDTAKLLGLDEKSKEKEVLILPADFYSEEEPAFLWHPYFPIGEYTVLMSAGGSGKTYLCCAIAASITTGKPLPGGVFNTEPRNVLFISAEDAGGYLRKRLCQCGADISKVYISDCRISANIELNGAKLDLLSAEIAAINPALVVVDPWHAFIGDAVDLGRANSVRPVFQRIVNMAKECNCAVVLVSHINKRPQGENTNFAATGSTDFINAARSALRIVDDLEPGCRVVVHTKSNYAAAGKSIRFEIDDNGFTWRGFSDIDRALLEEAARRKSTPGEWLQRSAKQEKDNEELIAALTAEADAAYPQAAKFSYESFKEKYGSWIFGDLQPKKALDKVKLYLEDEGYMLAVKAVKVGGKMRNGLVICRTNDLEED